MYKSYSNGEMSRTFGELPSEGGQDVDAGYQPMH